MMRKQNFTFNRGAYMQSAIIKVHGTTIEVSSGNDDDIYVYSDKGTIYVYSENSSLEYAGLETFNRQTGEREFDIFIQEQCDDLEWLLRTSRTPSKIRFLSQWDM